MATPDIYQVPDLSGKRAIVTGGSRGIGAATVRLLATAGAEVLIGARDANTAHALVDSINSQLSREAAAFDHLDLADLNSVRTFSGRLQGQPIDLLINNAGVMEKTLRRTVDGFEWNFGINFVSHFLLSRALSGNLKKGRGARVIQLSSGSHRFAPFEFDDPNFDRAPFNGDLAYPRSKTACALFAVGFSKRFAPAGIEAFSVSPGVVRTELLNVLGEAQIEQMMHAVAPLVRTADQAALTIVYAATAPELKGRGGAYIEDCSIAPLGAGDKPGGVTAHAIDPEAADRLWTLAEAAIQRADAAR